MPGPGSSPAQSSEKTESIQITIGAKQRPMPRYFDLGKRPTKQRPIPRFQITQSSACLEIELLAVAGGAQSVYFCLSTSHLRPIEDANQVRRGMAVIAQTASQPGGPRGPANSKLAAGHVFRSTTSQKMFDSQHFLVSRPGKRQQQPTQAVIVNMAGSRRCRVFTTDYPTGGYDVFKTYGRFLFVLCTTGQVDLTVDCHSTRHVATPIWC